MRIRNINKVLGAGALALLLIGCTDDNDWGTDAAHNRLFGVNESISVDAEDTQATITFKGVPQADQYIIEVSTDSLYDDVPMEGPNAKVFKITQEKLANYEVIIKGLTGETDYYLRIKSHLTTGDIADSRWVYYRTGSGKGRFTTKAEQLFYDLTAADIEDGKLHVSWKAASEVTNLVVLANGEEVSNITLTADDIAAGEYDILNLAPTTTYVIELYNGSVRRGSLQVTTPASMPAADYKYTLADDVKLIDNELMKEIAATAQEASDDPSNYSVTIGIPAGAVIDIHGVSEADEPTNLTIPDGMSVTFFGLSGGDTPVLKLQKNFDLAGSHAFIKFQNVNIVDDGAAYFINQSKAATIGQFTVEECEVSGQKNAFFRLQGTNGVAITTLTLTNSIFHHMCSGYSFIHIDAGSGAGHVDNIVIKSSTIYNVATGGKMFIYSKNTAMESIEIDGLTMYNSIGNNNYLVDFGSADIGPQTFVVNNSIFAKTPDEATKNIRSSVLPEFYNTWTTTDFFKTLKGAEALDLSSDDIFADPANGDFTLKVSTLKAGDPRWIPVEE